MKHLILTLATLLLLGCGGSQGEKMIVTAVHNDDDITLLSTNATDNHPTAQYAKVNGFWGAGEDYENGTKLKYNGAIHEVEIPHGAVDWKPLVAYSKDTIIKYVEYGKVYYVKALIDVPKGYDYDEPTDSELNTQCIVGARPVSNFTWRYKRRIENFDYTTNNKWFCNGVGGSDSYEHEIYTTGGNAPSTKYKITNKGTIDNPKDDVVSDEEIPPVKLGFPNSSYKIPFFIANGDLYEKNMEYDGTYITISPLNSKYYTSIDILDTFYYSPLNQNKIFDNDINSKTVRDNNLTFKFKVNASKFYLYGVTGEHLTIKVDGVTKLGKDLIYQEHGSTEWVKLGDTNATHTVDVEITADGLECALGDVYINKQKSINLGITDFNVDFSTLDTSKLERKAGGVIDIKKGIKFITAKVTVHNYTKKRYTLLKILNNLTAKRYAFDIEDSELQEIRDPESVFIVGRLQTSGLKLENKNNKLSELTPLSFTIEEFA